MSLLTFVERFVYLLWAF